MTAQAPEDRIAALEKQMEVTHGMVKEMHDALMLAQPGQNKSLLERMASVTIGIESGTRTIRFFLFVVAFLAAIGISFRIGIHLPGVSE